LFVKTEIEGYVAEIAKNRFTEIERIREIFNEMNEDIPKLSSYLLVNLPKPNLSDINCKVVAVDGSSYQEEYESISVSLAIAYIYTPNGHFEGYLPRISLIPPYYSSLTNSILMKTIEYQLLYEVITKMYEANQAPDLVLIDGTITFPDVALEQYIDRAPWIKEVFKEYKKVAENLFNFINRNQIPLFSVVKDSQSNKYFLSLYRSLIEEIDDGEVSLSDIQKIRDEIRKWGEGIYSSVSENSMIRSLFNNASLKRLKIVEVTRALRSDIPVKNLQGNVYGTYIKIVSNQKPFFIEMPYASLNTFNNSIKILTSLCYFSLRQGYPLPLFAAHKRVTLKKAKARRIVSLLKIVARKEIPEGYEILFEKKFREMM